MRKLTLTVLTMLLAASCGRPDENESTRRSLATSEDPRMPGWLDAVESDADEFDRNVGEYQRTAGLALTTMLNDAFAAERDGMLALPAPYRDTATRLRNFVGSYRKLYVDLALETGTPPAAPLADSFAREETASQKGDFVIDPTVPDCSVPGQKPIGKNASGRDLYKHGLAKWTKRYVWHMLGPTSDVFLACSRITVGDPLQPALAKDCEAAVVALGDHALRFAIRSKAADGREELSWGNMKGAWDAWRNDTCSKANGASSWATGWAMQMLANAYQVSSAPRFKTGIDQAMRRLHPKTIGNAALTEPSYVAMGLKLPYVGPTKSKFDGASIDGGVVTPHYTVGVSRAKLAWSSPWALRYHYKGENDPIRTALNTNVTIGVAQLSAHAAGMTAETYDVASPAGTAQKAVYFTESLRSIGTRVLQLQHVNFHNDNFAYTDLDDPWYELKHRYVVEAHVVASIEGLARAAALLDNPYYRDSAVRAARWLETATSAPATALTAKQKADPVGTLDDADRERDEFKAAAPAKRVDVAIAIHMKKLRRGMSIERALCAAAPFDAKLAAACRQEFSDKSRIGVQIGYVWPLRAATYSPCLATKASICK